MSSLFQHPDDVALVDDLDKNGAMRRSTWASMRIEGNERLSSALLRNHQRVNGPAWISWLVTRHRCLPLAKVRVSREWVRAQQFGQDTISHFREEGVVPIAKESSGWFLATMLPCARGKWEARMGDKVFLIAATPSDVAEALAWF